MIAALLDTDTVSLINKQDPQVFLNSTIYLGQFGQFTFSEFSYYEVTRGYKAAASTARLARFEQFCQSHRIINFPIKPPSLPPTSGLTSNRAGY